jgi:cysteine-rich repeat protein
MWKRQIAFIVGLILTGLLGSGCVLDWDEAGSVCGDGVIEGSEECDEGAGDSDPGCSVTCKVVHGWTCTGEPSVCTTTCGDGIIAAGVEECDDDVIPPTSYDGCSSSCQEEASWSCSGEPSLCIPGGV